MEASRDRIFFVKLRTQRIETDFTVKDGERVEKILREKGPIRQE